MTALFALLWLAGGVVLGFAISANRRASLLFTTLWVAATWIAIGFSIVAPTSEVRYVAIALIGCSGVSVLGARWPGAAVWQFVVLGLLGISLLPLIEATLGDRPLIIDGVRLVFAIGLLGTVIVNYLPTRLGLGVALVGLGAASGLSQFAGQSSSELRDDMERLAFMSAPLVGWLCLKSRRFVLGESNRLWLDFRDRFGAIWSLRAMEQFNRSAANAGSATTLTWNGLCGPDGPEANDRLCALLKRFGLPAN